MTQTFGSDNAIGWVQVRLRGGARTLLTTTVAYAAVIFFSMMASLRLSEAPASQVFTSWAAGLMGLQAAVLLLLGTSRVSTSIRQDLNSGIIESHRLMPVAPAQAVLGYLFGPTLQALCLAAVNLLLGAFAAASGGIAVGHWLGANLVLLAFAVFMWVVIAFGSFVPRNPIGLAIFAPLILVGGQGGIAPLVPGLTLLCTPLLGSSVFDMTATVGGLTTAFSIALAGQAVVGALFFTAATRKYRRSDAVGFSPALGLALLAAWVALSLVGTSWWEEVAPSFARWADVSQSTQLLASLLIAMLIALVPVWAAADMQVTWLAAMVYGGGKTAIRRPPPSWLVILAACLIILPLVAGGDRLGLISFPPQVLPAAALAVLFHLVSSSCLRLTLGFYTTKANGVFFVYLVLLWGLPLLVDVMISQVHGLDPTLGPISCVSPLGTIIALASERAGDVPIGLAVQGALALLTAAFYVRTHPARRRALAAAKGPD